MDKQVETKSKDFRPTQRSLPMVLLRTSEAVTETFRPMLKSLRVTGQQWRVLRVVAEAGTIDASEVAKRAAVLPPSLTRMLRLLEKRKLIKRKKDKRDGRRVILEIAPNGLALINRGAPLSLTIHKNMEDHFGQERMNTLRLLLAELTAVAEALLVQGRQPR